MLKTGLVSLPNVDKFTVSNVLTRWPENSPFCTITQWWWRRPDERTHILRAIAKISVGVPGMIEFVDVAGLVAGASKAKVSGSPIYSPTLLN